MVLVSFKNIHIWLSYGQKVMRMPIFGHTFFGHNSAISGPSGPKFFMGVKNIIIYRLVMRNLSYNTQFSFLIFWATFGGKMGWPSRAPLMVWGLQTQPKSWPTRWTFWANRYL